MDLKPGKVQVSSIYGKLTFLFIFLAFVLVLLIVFFSLSKAIVYINPVKKDVTVDFIANVKTVQEASELSENEISGIVMQKIVEGEKEITATGEKVVPKEDSVVGTVTVFNNYNKDQPLVSSTRLLSSDNILFRINKTILVPAGGKADVSVYSDDPDSLKGKTISPTKFTIPGLWPGLQDKIYAQSFEAFSMEGAKVHFVQKEDIENGQTQLSEELYKNTVDEVLKEYEAQKYTILASKELAQTITEKEAEETADKFKMSVRLKINIVLFNQDDVTKLIENELKKQIEEGNELISIDLDSIKYSIDKIDLIDSLAHIKVSATGKAVIKIDSKILDKGSLTGLNTDKVREKLMQGGSIEEVSVKLNPSWISHMPYLKDHISIIIER